MLIVLSWRAMTEMISASNQGGPVSKGRASIRTICRSPDRSKSAVRKAGGNPNRIGRGSGSAGGRKGEGGGRFNAHGRGAKVVASFPHDGGGWQRIPHGRFRSRRVVVKARVVKLNPQRRAHAARRCAAR